MTTQIIGRIYKITSSECEGVYIGSTTQQLRTRFSKHKSDYKRYLDGRTNSCYITSFDITKHSDAIIELIHEGIFNDKKDLEKMEGEIIRTTSCCVNKILVGRTNQQLYIQRKEYYDANKDILSIQNKEYYKANKDKISIQKKEYFEANKDKLNEQHMCPICNSQYRYKNKTNHAKSVNHLKALEQLSQE